MSPPNNVRPFRKFQQSEYESTGTYHYFGGISLGKWKVFRVTVADPGEKLAATETNNEGVTSLAAAWTDRATLTYE